MRDDNKPSSVHNIAQSLLTPAPEQPTDDAQEQSEPEEVIEEDTLDEGNDGADDSEVSEEDLYDDGEEPETLEEGEDEEDTDGEDDAGDTGVLEIDDDDLIEVKIDGQIEYRSIADAKKALSGEGAYDKRVKEATELRKQAQAESSQMQSRFQEAVKQFDGVIKELEGGLLQPQVDKPTAQLKQQNPQAYQQQLAAYAEDQERLENGRKALGQLSQRQQKLIAEQREEYRKEQAAKLREVLPELTDKEKSPKLVEDMLKTAQHYGFSEDEINSQLDHRYYKMVADLAKMHGARSAVTKKANTVKNLEGQKGKTPRKLRSGATSAKSNARRQAEKQKQVTNNARKSGKVKDVAATLIRSKG